MKRPLTISSSRTMADASELRDGGRIGGPKTGADWVQLRHQEAGQLPGNNNQANKHT